MAESRQAPFTLIWTIENFSPQTCLTLSSPSFIVESMGNTKWHIELEKFCNFGCCFGREGNEDRGPKRIQIDFEIAVLADDGSVLVSKTGRYVFKKKPYCTYAYLLNLDDPLWSKWRKSSSRDILTIRCRMWKIHASKRIKSSSFDMCFASSKLSVEQNSFIWSIRDFSSLLEKQKTSLSWKSTTNDEPIISLDLRLSEYKNEEEVSISPTLEKHSDSNYAISYSISMLDARGREVVCFTNRRCMDYSMRTYSFSIISKSKLIANKDLYLKNDVLLLRCTFKVGMGVVSESVEYSRSTSTSSVNATKFNKKGNESSISYGIRKIFKGMRDKLFSRPLSAIGSIENKPESSNEEEKEHSRATFSCASHSLKKALKGLFEDGVLSDVTLRTGDEFFSVHRNIVSARSPVFRSMFDKEVKEHDVIDVPDLDADTLQSLLLFLYTETAKDPQCQDASDLFKAAHLYRMGDLAEVCSSFLRDNLNKSNAEDAYSVGESFKSLKTKISN
ncbi:TD and POZ domain-containing protein 4 [Caerostris darwini]|uniref:TD and POZ domain-containing protein 4 n=1 Tax=Caerostris darwini TaxID=1538125 RepID=A0AAV4RMB0_9ARAC|nr:TD and POZ domain-containing protein 4 [Caerostris darwini]